MGEIERRSARPVDGSIAPGVVLGLFCFALLVRVGAAWRTAVIFNDGPVYLEIASQMAAGEWRTALGHHYHPLYPLLVAAAHLVIGEMELAAVCVSVLGGACAVVALYAFLLRAFDRQVAWVGAALLALHPYAAEFSADVMSEGVYLALFLGAVASSWRALQGGRPAAAWTGGLLTGLAYLARPEGLALAAVAGGFGSLRIIRRQWTVAAGARWLAALALGAAVVVGPYVVTLHDRTGEWLLTQKKSLSALTTRAAPPEARPPGVPDRFAPRARPSPPSLPRQAAGAPGVAVGAMPLLAGRIDGAPRGVVALAELGRVTYSAFQPVYWLLLALGLYRFRGRGGERAAFVAAIVAVYTVLLYALVLNVGYLDRRHALPMMLPLLGHAACGVPIAGAALARLLRVRPGRTAWLVLALVAAITLPKTLAPHREERLATRRAAEWLASQAALSGPVASAKSRDAYYARADYIHFSRGGPTVDPAALHRAGARFLIVDDVQLAKHPGLRTACAGLPELHRAEAAGRTAFVYELSGSSPGVR